MFKKNSDDLSQNPIDFEIKDYSDESSSSMDDESGDEQIDKNFTSDDYREYRKDSREGVYQGRPSIITESQVGSRPSIVHSRLSEMWSPVEDRQPAKFQKLVQANDVTRLNRIDFKADQVKDILSQVLTDSAIRVDTLKYLLRFVAPSQLNQAKLNRLFNFVGLDEVSRDILSKKQKMLTEFFNPPSDTSTPGLS